MFLTNLLLPLLGLMVAGSISPLRELVTKSTQRQILYSATIYTDGRPTEVHVDNLPPSSEARIQTGTPMSESEVYPFIGALGFFELIPAGDGTASMTYLVDCTASLIGNKHILTAGHCNNPKSSGQRRIYIHSMSDIRIQSGDDYQKKSKNWATVSSMETHPKYDKSGTLVYDVSVGTLEEPLEADGVSPICLAQKNYTKSIIAAGWGLYDCDNASQEALRRANGKIIKTSECNKMLKNNGEKVSKLHICSTFTLDNGDAAAVAPGDSGGPLVSMADPSKPVQIGVASFIIPTVGSNDTHTCVNKEKPQVYGSVAEMKEFISGIATEAQWC